MALCAVLVVKWSVNSLSNITPMLQHADTRRVSPEAVHVSFSVLKHAVCCVLAGIVWQVNVSLALICAKS